MYNYFILDDNNPTINSDLARVLEDLPEFHCVGYGTDYNQSMNIILKESPDLIFLNLDLNEMNPFEFAKEINEYLKSSPEIIAISSNTEKTYESIKAGFFDYLLTPIVDLEIRKTVLRLKKKCPPKKSSTICLKSYKDYRYLNTDDILFLRADNNTTDFHMSNGSVINSFKTLKTYETLLPKNFLRVHKSYIINSNYVSRVNYANSKCTLKSNDEKVPFTKYYKDNMEYMINTLTPPSKAI